MQLVGGTGPTAHFISRRTENNPALREDPTVPVAAEDVKRLPINPQSERGRKVTRDEHEEARERHRDRMNTPESADRYK